MVKMQPVVQGGSQVAGQGTCMEFTPFLKLKDTRGESSVEIMSCFRLLFFLSYAKEAERVGEQRTYCALVQLPEC